MKHNLETYLSLLGRYDPDGFTPYLFASDFPGLLNEKESFKNSNGINIAYFKYSYNFNNKLILFLPGMGAGHIAYTREIEYLCKKGYSILTLDYTGCCYSEGSGLESFNNPIIDTIDLLTHLNITNIDIIGHSMGAYAAISITNIMHMNNKCVANSPFITLDRALPLVGTAEDAPFILERDNKYLEKYHMTDNFEYLKQTNNKVLFIHSKNDNVICYEMNTKQVEKLGKDNLKCLVTDNKYHLPHYSKESVDYLNDAFASFTKELTSGKLESLESKIEFMKKYSVYKMTNPDEDVWEEILNFLKN